MAEPAARRLAELEGAEAAVLVHSAPAAVTCTLLAMLHGGDELLASNWLRPATRRLFDEVLVRLGITVHYIDPLAPREWRRGVQSTTRLLYVEAPVLDTTRLIDLRPLRALTREAGLAFVVDATAASPAGFQPITHGADIVLHDAGHLLDPSGAQAVGTVAGGESVIEEIAARMRSIGAEPHPAAVSALEQGLTTLELRVARQQATAAQLADTLAARADVRTVYYPGASTHPDHAVACALLRGFGTQLQLELPDEEAVTRLSSLMPNAGEATATDSCVALLPDPRQVTLSVGLESPELLLAMIGTALDTRAA